MAHSTRLVPALAFCAASLLAVPLHAQQKPDIPLDPRVVGGVPLDSSGAPIQEDVPQLSTGLIGGSIRYAGGRTEQAVSALIQMSPTPWMSLTAAPGYGHTTLGSSTTDGMTEVPVSASVLFGLGDLPWMPLFSVTGSSVLTLGDRMSGVGAGSSSMDAGVGMLAWPMERLALSVGGTFPIARGVGNSMASAEVAIPLEPFITTLGYTSEFGTADTGAQLARSMTGGVAIAVGGPLTLTLDGSHGLTTGAPDWSFSVGLGTAFTGISPLNASTAVNRLKRVFGRRMLSTSGYTSGCKAEGMC
ncbi:MAG TPA: hypothetical protein VJU87_05015 [Gemmatimonadaceae bacterium]|nr:hypothetical protein [Gemmatimonadaceae bacterium]